MKKLAKRRKHSLKYWDPFRAHFADKVRSRSLKPRAIVIRGLLAFGVEIILVRLTSYLAWLKHGFEIAALVLVAVLIGFIEQIEALVIDFWRTCREEPFREVSADYAKITVFGILLCLMWGCVMGIDNYVHSSHFKLQVEGPYIVSNIVDYPTIKNAVHPVSSIFFTHLQVTNTGTPAIPRNWRLVVELPDGTSITGVPSLHGTDFSGTEYERFSGGKIGPRAFIYGPHPLIGLMVDRPHSGTTSGCAEFIFEGVPEEELITRGADWLIEFDGLNQIMRQKVLIPAKAVPMRHGLGESGGK